MKNLALVGGAHIHTPRFIKTIRSRPELCLKYVWDQNEERLKKRILQSEATPVTDRKLIWQDESIDGVVICSETIHHESLVHEAIAAGKHLFVEKPLGMNSRDSLAMAEKISSSGLIFQTGYFQRSNSINQQLKKMIQNGDFGKIVRMRISNAHDGAMKGLFDHEWRWMADVEQAGIGGFGDLGAHAIDLALWLLADEPVSAHAMTKTCLDRYPGCDEYGEGLIEFKGGTLVSIAAGWTDFANPIKFTLSGTEGSAYVYKGGLYVKTAELGGEDFVQVTDLPAEKPHAFDMFLDAILGKEADLVAPMEAAKVNVVLEQMYQSKECLLPA